MKSFTNVFCVRTTCAFCESALIYEDFVCVLENIKINDSGECIEYSKR